VGTDGLVVNAKRAQVADYTDLCRPDLKGKTAVRLRRPTLMAFAFAAGKTRSRFTAIRRRTARSWIRWCALIACKANFKFFYDNKDQLLNGIRSAKSWQR